MFAVVGQDVDLNQLEVETDVAQAEVEQSRSLRALEEQRRRAAEVGQSIAALDAQIANARENVEALESLRQVTPGRARG